MGRKHTHTARDIPIYKILILVHNSMISRVIRRRVRAMTFPFRLRAPPTPPLFPLTFLPGRVQTDKRKKKCPSCNEMNPMSVKVREKAREKAVSAPFKFLLFNPCCPTSTTSLCSSGGYYGRAVIDVRAPRACDAQVVAPHGLVGGKNHLRPDDVLMRASLSKAKLASSFLTKPRLLRY